MLFNIIGIVTIVIIVGYVVVALMRGAVEVLPIQLLLQWVFGL